MPYAGGMDVEWIDEARKIVSGLNEKQSRMLYGTNDKEEQARIEASRMAESSRRKVARARFERLVDAGAKSEDAETVIEFEDAGLFQIRTGPQE